MRRLAGVGVALVVGLAAASCAVVAAPSIRLLTAPRVQTCDLGLHVPFTLVIDSAASPPVWGKIDNGSPFAIIWPAGFTLMPGGVADPPGVDRGPQWRPDPLLAAAQTGWARS